MLSNPLLVKTLAILTALAALSLAGIAVFLFLRRRNYGTIYHNQRHQWKTIADDLNLSYSTNNSQDSITGSYNGRHRIIDVGLDGADMHQEECFYRIQTEHKLPQNLKLYIHPIRPSNGPTDDFSTRIPTGDPNFDSVMFVRGHDHEAILRTLSAEVRAIILQHTQPDTLFRIGHNYITYGTTTFPQTTQEIQTVLSWQTQLANMMSFQYFGEEHSSI